MPLQCHLAVAKSVFPIARADEFEAKLRAADVDLEFHRYMVQPAFANETQVEANRRPITGFHPDAAALAWTRALGFLGRCLR